MPEHVRIGTVDVLRLRIYPLDAESSLDSGRFVVVTPGEYPLYRTGDATYWMLTGQLNARDWHRIGDGLFLAGGSPRGEGPPVTFPSQIYGPDAFAKLLKDPTLDGRVRFWIDETVNHDA
jgi:hypothetical protein